MADKSQKQSSNQGHVAVIYFHGMGDQRRYEEMSGLIDSIDTHLSRCDRKPQTSKGYLARIRPRVESSREVAGSTETYIRADHRQKDKDNPGIQKKARFYEVYWAPVMAEHSSARRVLMWMFSQLTHPLKVIKVPWRERQRLKRAVLLEMYEQKENWPEGVGQWEFEKLLSSYNTYERSDEARQRYRSGSKAGFNQFLAQELEDQPEKRNSCLNLSNAWSRRYYLGELKNGFFLLTLGLLLVILLGVTVVLVLKLLQQFAAWDSLGQLLAVLPEPLISMLNPTWGAAATLTVTLLGLIGINSFLTKYVGDVESWATYEETDAKHLRRSEVIARGVRVLGHVLKDPECSRVVVIGHSLGTSIAHDTLLAVARNNRVANSEDSDSQTVPLDKISHFITLASPIDKIQYFFESYKSHYHQYKKVQEELRGDIGSPPFTQNRKPHIHWVNYWDEADIISGPVHSPVNRRSFDHRVDNIHISNLYFPDPGVAHSAYFENRRVISDIFEIIFKSKNSFCDPIQSSASKKDFDSIRLPKGDKTGNYEWAFLAAVSFPWFLLIGGIFELFNEELTAKIFLGISGLAFIFLLVGYFIGLLRGQRFPL